MLIKEIVENQLVNGKYRISDSRPGTAKTGNKFLSLKLSDSSGEINAKVWNISDELQKSLAVGGVIELTNIVCKSFNGQKQLDWDSSNRVYRVLTEEEIDYSEFLPQSPVNLDEKWSFISSKIDSIQEPLLKSVLDSFFNDEKTKREFLRMPAAIKRHQAYIGGLLEHTAGVVAMAEAAAAYYPGVNRDLLLTGAILHDIGKIKNYSLERGIEGTDEGMLIGHLILGVGMVERALQDVMPEPDEHNRSLGRQLLHLLVSHHGIMEWGSPIEPLTVEGCILHHADNMDAETSKYISIIEEYSDSGESWTPYNTSLKKSLYMGLREQKK